MTDAVGFYRLYCSTIKSAIDNIEALRLMNSRLTQEAGLAAAAASAASAGGRADLQTADFTNAQAAIVQVLFTYDSGAPTQKSYLFRML